MTCVQNCRRLCIRGHPCDKPCAESCGDCQFPVLKVELPCGHRKTVPWCFIFDQLELEPFSDHIYSHRMESLADIYCDETVTKSLPGCEHHARMPCSEDPLSYRCLAPCDGIMSSCCGRNCRSSCSECQRVNQPAAEGHTHRTLHKQHPCQKTLYCGHQCCNPCSADHQCTTECLEACRQVCSHARCKKRCSESCAPCQEPCTW